MKWGELDVGFRVEKEIRGIFADVRFEDVRGC